MSVPWVFLTLPACSLISFLSSTSSLVKGFLLGARCAVDSRPEGLGGLAFSQGYWRFFYAIARAACKILYLKTIII